MHPISTSNIDSDGNLLEAIGHKPANHKISELALRLLPPELSKQNNPEPNSKPNLQLPDNLDITDVFKKGDLEKLNDTDVDVVSKLVQTYCLFDKN